MIGQEGSMPGLQEGRALVDQRSSYPTNQGGGIISGSLQSLLRLGTVDQGMSAASANAAQLTDMPRGMFDAFVNTCQRWRLEQSARLRLLGFSDHDFLGSQLLVGRVPARTQDVKDRIGYVLAISLGLGTIFNEAAAPELDWLSSAHPKLGESPLEHILRGRMVHLIAVVDLVGAERNL
jgi:hypothetical protein